MRRLVVFAHMNELTVFFVRVEKIYFLFEPISDDQPDNSSINSSSYSIGRHSISWRYDVTYIITSSSWHSSFFGHSFHCRKEYRLRASNFCNSTVYCLLFTRGKLYTLPLMTSLLIVTSSLILWRHHLCCDVITYFDAITYCDVIFDSG